MGVEKRAVFQRCRGHMGILPETKPIFCAKYGEKQGICSLF